MKKFLIAAMTVAALSASAQSRFEPGTLTLQPRLGFTGSMLTNMPDLDLGLSKDLDATSIVGCFLGADLEYQFTNSVSVSAGLNWAQAGTGWEDAKINVSDEISATGASYSIKMKDIKVQTSYINLPVVVNWYVAKGLAVKAGVQFGYLTSAKTKLTVEANEVVNIKSDIDQSCKDEFNKFDLSIPIGLSYEFKKPFVIDARAIYGLTKVNKESVPGEDDSKNVVFALTFGYKFKL